MPSVSHESGSLLIGLLAHHTEKMSLRRLAIAALILLSLVQQSREERFKPRKTRMQRKEEKRERERMLETSRESHQNIVSKRPWTVRKCQRQKRQGYQGGENVRQTRLCSRHDEKEGDQYLSNAGNVV